MHGQDPAARRHDAGHLLGQRFGGALEVDQGHRRAHRCELGGYGRTHAALVGGTGDDRDLPVEAHATRRPYNSMLSNRSSPSNVIASQCSMKRPSLPLRKKSAER